MSSLTDLYAQIPSVDCIPGCTDCCGPIPVAREEAAHFGPFPLLDMGEGMSISFASPCPNSKGGNCRIHEARPFICRLFGTVDAADTLGTPEAKMVCPHGRKPKKPLTRAEAADLMRRYLEVMSATAREPDTRGEASTPDY